MDFNRLRLERALETLGAVLEQRGLRFELVAIGGSSLLLLGLISRPTGDLDILALVEGGRYVRADPLPADLTEAVGDVGAALGLGNDWLNPGPTALLDLGLPAGFEQRVETRRYNGLVLHLASRFDQICFKLYGAVDQSLRSKHADDLRRLDPASDELFAAARWTRTHDPSEPFGRLLVMTLVGLGVENADAAL
ncbi:MAG: hypothetical protein H0V51_06025 [Chloroflexi bacterium]|nr:hypothetical protein [Chloroflexota bacterium]